MKKCLVCLLVLVLSLSALQTLAVENPAINEKFNNEEMRNIHGETVKIDKMENLLMDVGMGMAVLMPDHMSAQDPVGQYQRNWTPASIGFHYIPDAHYEVFKTMEEMSDEQMEKLMEDEEVMAAFFEKVTAMDAAMVSLFSILVVNPEREYNTELEAEHKAYFQHIEHLVDSGKDKIFLAYNSAFDDFELSDKEKEALKAFVQQGLDLVRSGLMLFAPADYFEVHGVDEQAVQLDGDAAAFASTDLYGKPFGPEDIAQYDLTLVNVWFTGCGPCIHEMPGLQALKEALPKNVNLFTICLDGESENELAVGIVESVGATFTTLKGDEMSKGVLRNIQAAPTTFFLDKQGNQVGLAIVGAFSGLEKFVETGLDIVNQRLAMLK